MGFWDTISLHRRARYARVPGTGDTNPASYTPAGTAILASAALVDRNTVRTVVSNRPSWQAEAWELYDRVPELRFGVGWSANAASRARLYVGRVDRDGSSEPLPIDGDDPSLSDTLKDQLLAPLHELTVENGQGNLLRRSALLLNLPGELYLIGFDDVTTRRRRWVIASSDEVQSTSTGIRLHDPVRPNAYIHLGHGAFTLIRIWRPAARYAHEPDSPMVALREPLRELIGLSAHVTATTDSRLAGAGLLFVPDGLSLPAPSESDGVNPLHSDELMAALIEAMAAPLKNRDSASAVVPLMLRGPSEEGAALKHMAFGTKLDEAIPRLRESAIRRIALGLDLPPEVLTGMGDSTNHWCTLPEVEILTARGWRRHDALIIGEPVLTLDHTTGMSRWQPLQAVNRWQVTDETMVHITGPGHTSVTTPAHRWPVMTGAGPVWTTSGRWAADAHKDGPQTPRDERMQLAVPHADLPAAATHSDSLVELVAWYAAFGDLYLRDQRRNPRVILSVPAAFEHHGRIERALTALFGPPSESLGPGGWYAKTATIGEHRRARARRTLDPRLTAAQIADQIGVTTQQARHYLRAEPRLRDTTPRWRRKTAATMTRYRLNWAASEQFTAHMAGLEVARRFVMELTAAQLQLFMDTCVRASGRHDGLVTHPALAGAYELAAVLAGKSVRRLPLALDAGEVEAVAADDEVTFAPRGRDFGLSFHTGTVWCPTTRDGTWLARHNGTVFFTGNSAWQIGEDALKLHVEPMLGVMCDALTTHFYRPALTALGVDSPEDWAIWYDTSRLANRPDRSPEALEAHGRGVLSDEALLRILGLAPEDAPSDKDRAVRLAREVALANPSLAPLLLPALGVDAPGIRALALDAVRAGARTPNHPPTHPPTQEDEPLDSSTPATGRPSLPSRPSPRSTTLTMATDDDDWRLRCLEMAVIRALGRAGQYLLRSTPRAQRARLPVMPQHSVHTQLVAPSKKLDDMLRNAFAEFQQAVPDAPCLHAAVDEYVRSLLVTGQPHQLDYLRAAIIQQGCDDER